ncbi:spore coat U domain-containing protein [Jeongeupia sp. USM3]|uniref:Csu type fimbrial protein n=1 Tax=Jeongeupia sp. USM3 TaxID=1906741 RepID=UPI00089DEB3C|nr:spore coat U domain-containing protein [Jeongeupia sp. USM3]AOY00351.1 hypothetical protein BJP62_07770 [Jeongeupia sp. USM3]
MKSLLVLMPCGLLASVAHATTVNATLTVNATVVAACTVEAATLAFGNYDPTSNSDTNVSTTINFSCTPSTAYTVSLDAGLNSASIAAGRNMKAGSDLLQYQLYTDSGWTNYWGNTGSNRMTGTSAAGSLANTLTVYGKIPKNQIVPASAAYTDSVNIAVSF